MPASMRMAFATSAPVSPLEMFTFWPALKRVFTNSDTPPERARVTTRIIMYKGSKYICISSIKYFTY